MCNKSYTSGLYTYDKITIKQLKGNYGTFKINKGTKLSLECKHFSHTKYIKYNIGDKISITKVFIRQTKNCIYEFINIKENMHSYIVINEVKFSINELGM